jgi:hypothetical protein
MRLIWFLPLTYLAGIDGFGWFIPYLLVVGIVAALVSRLRSVRRRGIRVRIPVPGNLLEFEAAAA